MEIATADSVFLSVRGRFWHYYDLQPATAPPPHANLQKRDNSSREAPIF